METRRQSSSLFKYNWFALAVRSRYERAVGASLQGKGIQTLVPCYLDGKRKNYTQPAEVPLFPGYVFVYIDIADRLPVLVTPHVRSIVGYGKVPAPVPEEEIACVQTVISSKQLAQPWPYDPTLGDHVRVEYGPLAGLEGTLVQLKSSLRVVISVNLLQRAVAVEVGPEMLSKAGPTCGEELIVTRPHTARIRGCEPSLLCGGGFVGCAADGRRAPSSLRTGEYGNQAS